MAKSKDSAPAGVVAAVVMAIALAVAASPGEAAEAMAHTIARFPQEAVRADRASIIETRGMTVRDGLRHEWANGINAIIKEGIDGATRFSAGAGRHGDFENI